MTRALAYLGQAGVYLLTALLLGSFSTWPAYRAFPEDQARLVVSFSHGADRKGACRKLTPEEIAEIAANMRKAEVCPRERLPIFLEITLSGDVLYQASVDPTGLAGDGASQVYERFAVAPGRHRLRLRLRDSARETGFDYEREAEILLRPGQNFVADFRAEMGGFFFPGGEG